MVPVVTNRGTRWHKQYITLRKHLHTTCVQYCEWIFQLELPKLLGHTSSTMAPRVCEELKRQVRATRGWANKICARLDPIGAVKAKQVLRWGAGDLKGVIPVPVRFTGRRRDSGDVKVPQPPVPSKLLERAQGVGKRYTKRKNPLYEVGKHLNFSDRGTDKQHLINICRSVSAKTGLPYCTKSAQGELVWDHNKLWAAAIASEVASRLWPPGSAESAALSESERSAVGKLRKLYSERLAAATTGRDDVSDKFKHEVNRVVSCYAKSCVSAQVITVADWPRGIMELRVVDKDVASSFANDAALGPARANANVPLHDRRLVLLCSGDDNHAIKDYQERLRVRSNQDAQKPASWLPLDPVFMPTIHPGAYVGDVRHQANVFLDYQPSKFVAMPDDGETGDGDACGDTEETKGEDDDDAVAAIRADDPHHRKHIDGGMEGVEYVVFVTCPSDQVVAFQALIERGQERHENATVYIVHYERSMGFGHAFTMCQLAADALGYTQYFQVDDDVSHIEEYLGDAKCFRHCSILRAMLMLGRVFRRAVTCSQHSKDLTDEEEGFVETIFDKSHSIQGDENDRKIARRSLLRHIRKNLNLFHQTPEAVVRSWDGLVELSPRCKDDLVQELVSKLMKDSNKFVAGVALTRLSHSRHMYNTVEKNGANFQKSLGREQFILNNVQAIRGIHMVPDSVVLYVDADKFTPDSASYRAYERDGNEDVEALEGQREMEISDKMREYEELVPAADSAIPREEEFSVVPATVVRAICTNQYRHPVRSMLVTMFVVVAVCVECGSVIGLAEHLHSRTWDSSCVPRCRLWQIIDVCRLRSCLRRTVVLALVLTLSSNLLSRTGGGTEDYCWRVE